jgi:hypothetical protein
MSTRIRQRFYNFEIARTGKMVNVTLSFKPCANEDGSLVANHGSNSSLAVEDAIDTIEALKRQEAKYDSSDYLSTGCASQDATAPSRVELNKSSDIDINEDCIATMCQWCFQVVDHYGFSRETTQVALKCLDLFLSTTAGKPYLISRTQYQLASMACLYVAIKVHERVELDVSAFVLLSRGSYTVSQIYAMELKVLTALDWNIYPPTETAFVRAFMALFPRSDMSVETKRTIYNLALHQTQIATCTYCLSVGVRPSAVALASVMNAIQLVSSHNAGDVGPTRNHQNNVQLKYATLRKHLESELGFDLQSENVTLSKRHLLAAISKNNEPMIIPSKTNGPSSTPCGSALTKSSSYRQTHSGLHNDSVSPVAVVSPK